MSEVAQENYGTDMLRDIPVRNIPNERSHIKPLEPSGYYMYHQP
jgi:hypothetical protein